MLLHLVNPNACTVTHIHRPSRAQTAFLLLCVVTMVTESTPIATPLDRHHDRAGVEGVWTREEEN